MHSEPKSQSTDLSPSRPPKRERSLVSLAWYHSVRFASAAYFEAMGGLRTSGAENIPKKGGCLLVSNHLSFADVFVLGCSCPRPISYVVRSTLFKPPLGFLIRSVGGFPIQRDGLGAQGLKETLKRLRAGSMVLLFPEGNALRRWRASRAQTGICKPCLANRVSSLAGRHRGHFRIVAETSEEAKTARHPHPLRREARTRFLEHHRPCRDDRNHSDQNLGLSKTCAKLCRVPRRIPKQNSRLN